MRTACLFATVVATAAAQVAPEPLHSIPFTTHANGVYLSVRVNGSQPMQFLFDTAAATHVLNAARIAEMNVGEPYAYASAKGAGDGSAPATIYQNVFLRAGRLELKPDRIVAINMSAIENRKGFALDGLIGAPLLRQFVVEVDTTASILKLYDPATWQYTGSGQTLPARFDKQGQPYLKATLFTAEKKAIEGEFLIDSAAAEIAAMLTTPFVAKHNLIESCKQADGVLPEETSGVGGTSRSWAARASALQIGNKILARPTVILMEAKGGTLARADIAGTLGGESLHRFRVIYDCSRGQIHLEPSDRLSCPFEQEMAGLRWLATGPEHRSFRVRAVIAGSPAAQAGIRTGDVLETVDGVSASTFNKATLNKTLTADGKNVRLRFRREGKAVEVQLTLRRLI